jgi:hypothetical protein
VKDSKQRWAPYVAAALLASLTIRVFSELQDYGPESAIRRFFGALGSPQALQDEITKGDLGDAELAMFADLLFWQTHGVTAQMGHVKVTGNEARVVVSFSFPNGTIWHSVWVVEGGGRKWLVNANKTATIFRDNRPPYFGPMH